MIKGPFRAQLLCLMSILLCMLFLQSVVSISDLNVHVADEDQSIDDFGREPPIIDIDPCADKAPVYSNRNNEPPPFPQDSLSQEPQEKCNKPVIFKTFENSTLGFQIQYGPGWHWESSHSSTEPDITFESTNTSHSPLDIDVQYLKPSAGLPFSCHGPSSQPGCKYFYSDDVSRYAYSTLELPSQLRRVVDYKTLIENPASISKYLNVSLISYGINDAKIIRSSAISIPSTSGTVYSGLEVLIQHLDDETTEKDVFVRDRNNGYHLVVWPNDDQDSEIQQMISSFTLISPPSKRSAPAVPENEIRIEVELPLDIKNDSLKIEIHEQKVRVTGSTFSNFPFEREIEIPLQADIKNSPLVQYIQNEHPGADFISEILVLTFNKSPQ